MYRDSPRLWAVVSLCCRLGPFPCPCPYFHHHHAQLPQVKAPEAMRRMRAISFLYRSYWQSTSRKICLQKETIDATRQDKTTGREEVASSSYTCLQPERHK